MFKKVILFAVCFCLLGLTSFAQIDAPKNRLLFGVSYSFPMEDLSLKIDEGIGFNFGVEKIIGNHYAILASWNYSMHKINTQSDLVMNEATLKGKFYLFDVNGEKKFLPYLIFGGGVITGDETESDFNAETVFGSTTGVGFLFDSKKDLCIYVEGDIGTGSEELSKFSLKAGLSLNVDLF